MRRLLCLALLCAALLAPVAVRAGDVPQFASVPKLSLHSATAAGWQANLRTGDLGRVALLLGVEATYDVGIPLGAGFFCGIGAAASSPNAAQCDVLLTAARFGAFGFGVQAFRDGGQAIYQGLVFVGVALPGAAF